MVGGDSAGGSKYTGAKLPGVTILYEDRENTSGGFSVYQFQIELEGQRFGIVGYLYPMLAADGAHQPIPGTGRYPQEIRSVSTSAAIVDRVTSTVLPTVRRVPADVYPRLAETALRIFSDLSLREPAVVARVVFRDDEAVEPKAYEVSR